METLLGFIVIICVFALPVALIFLLRKIRVLTLSTTDLARRIALLEQQPREVAPAAPVPVAAPREVPPPLPQIFPQPVVRPPELPKAPLAKPPRPAIDWESFLGVKLFAWLGGFVLFLGVVFLVKYSFENNLVTPATRIAIGAVIGLALVGAGWVTARRAYRIPGQSLCATGVLVLYADIFGAHAFYDLISLSSAFTLMSAVTLAAFFLAVRLDAQVIVILGLLGGFLTPPLLTRGEGAALALFGYIALLNAGVAAVALRKRWDYLVLLSAIGTILSEFAWPPLYRNANAEIAALVFLAFEAQFLAIHFLRGKLPPPTAWAMRAAVALGASALLFALYLIGESEIAARPAFIFSFIFLRMSDCSRSHFRGRIRCESRDSPAAEFFCSSESGRAVR